MDKFDWCRGASPQNGAVKVGPLVNMQMASTKVKGAEVIMTGPILNVELGGVEDMRAGGGCPIRHEVEDRERKVSWETVTSCCTSWPFSMT